MPDAQIRHASYVSLRADKAPKTIHRETAKTMDLSKYESLAAAAPEDLKVKYHHLRTRLELLLSAPTREMKAMDAVIVELDEVQAASRDSQKRSGDSQRF